MTGVLQVDAKRRNKNNLHIIWQVNKALSSSQWKLMVHLQNQELKLNNIDTNEILEEVKYSISLSVKDNYLVDSVIFMVDNVEIEKSVIKTLE